MPSKMISGVAEGQLSHRVVRAPHLFQFLQYLHDHGQRVGHYNQHSFPHPLDLQQNPRYSLSRLALSKEDTDSSHSLLRSRCLSRHPYRIVQRGSVVQAKRVVIEKGAITFYLDRKAFVTVPVFIEVQRMLSVITSGAIAICCPLMVNKFMSNRDASGAFVHS